MKQHVRTRAKFLCEYCRLPMGVLEEQFHIEHIRARHHGGPTTLENLALSCARCNNHKGPNLAGVDPQDSQAVLLFNPRLDSWSEHFKREGAMIHGTTPTGRATIAALCINHPDRVILRSLLIELGELQ